MSDQNGQALDRWAVLRKRLLAYLYKQKVEQVLVVIKACDFGPTEETARGEGFVRRNAKPINPPLIVSGDGMTHELARSGRPKIICLCGSTKFKQQFIQANFDETMKGNIVLSVGWFSHADGQIYSPTKEEKVALDELHKRKIDLADEVLVVTVGCYVGDSTKSEIEYARTQGKLISYRDFKEVGQSTPAQPQIPGLSEEEIKSLARDCVHECDGWPTTGAKQRVEKLLRDRLQNNANGGRK